MCNNSVEHVTLISYLFSIHTCRMMMIATEDNYFHFNLNYMFLDCDLLYVYVKQFIIITILVQENFNKLNCMTSNYIMDFNAGSRCYSEYQLSSNFLVNMAALAARKTEVELPRCPVRFVVVYPDRAEVTREVAVNLDAGEHEVQLKNISQALDKYAGSVYYNICMCLCMC